MPLQEVPRVDGIKGLDLSDPDVFIVIRRMRLREAVNTCKENETRDRHHCEEMLDLEWQEAERNRIMAEESTTSPGGNAVLSPSNDNVPVVTDGTHGSVVPVDSEFMDDPADPGRLHKPSGLGGLFKNNCKGFF